MRIFKKIWGTFLKQKLEKLWEMRTCEKFWRKLTKIFGAFLEQLDVFLTIFRKQKVIVTSGTKNNWDLK